MFCYSCGNAIQEQAEVCPICGAKAGGYKMQQSGRGAESSGWPSLTDRPEEAVSPDGGKRRERTAGPGVAMLLIGFVAVLAAIVVIALHFRKSVEEEYSIVGLWKSRDAVYVGENIAELLQDNGLSESIVSAILSFAGLGSDGEITLRFTEAGNIYVGANGLSVCIGNLQWEDLGDNRLMLKYSLDISVLGNSVPITIAYEAEYKIDKDNLTLDLFGNRARFSRLTQQ